jgi:hypothetical protein
VASRRRHCPIAQSSVGQGRGFVGSSATLHGDVDLAVSARYMQVLTPGFRPGADVERVTFARAVRWHREDRHYPRWQPDRRLLKSKRLLVRAH